MNLFGKKYSEPIGEIGELIEISEFIELCNDRSLIDYDGFGYAVKDDRADKTLVICPSKVLEIPSDATHIIWFNK